MTISISPPETNRGHATEVTQNASLPAAEKAINPGHDSPSPQLALDKETVELLGRQRPSQFSSIWSELAFCFSIFMCQILAEYYVSGANVLTPTLIKELDIPPGQSIWPSTALSLAVTSTLLTCGRLADMYGGFVLYIGGMAWLTVISLIAGFSQNWLMLFIFRALQGLGLAASLPSSIMILGRAYRPGPRKNLVFSIYGACAAMGFFVGIFFSGICGEFLSWSWYFYFGAIFSAVTLVSGWFSIPSDWAEKRKANVKMDWIGSALLVPGMVLLVFSLADSAHAPNGWKTPYIIVTIILGVLFLIAFTYTQGWVVKNPLLPADLFAVKYMTPLVIALLFLYGCLGVFLLYACLYMQEIMGASPLQVVAWAVPMAVGGLILSAAGGFLLHMLNGTILMIISCLGYLASGLLFALLPVGGNYWAFVFPAMIGGTVGIDISFNVTNIFITTSLSKERQGLAGALINSTLHFGIAIMLAFADIIQVETEKYMSVRDSYKSAFWFQVGLAGFGMALVIIFVRIESAKSGLTADEIAELEAAARGDESTGY